MGNWSVGNRRVGNGKVTLGWAAKGRVAKGRWWPRGGDVPQYRLAVTDYLLTGLDRYI